MPLINYQKYKINVSPDTGKTQGLKPGDIIRRQYSDGDSTIYTLMCVLETGIDKVNDGNGNLKDSFYFIGGLLEGDAPTNGQVLDFVRMTNVYDTDRTGALYLTASDSDAPYMSVIDTEAGEKSIAYPSYLAQYNTTVLRDAYCVDRGSGSSLSASYSESLGDRKRVLTASRTDQDSSPSDNLYVTFNDEFPLSTIILVSYRASMESANANLEIQFGYPDKSSYDAKETVTITTEEKLYVHVVQIDTAIRNTKCLFFSTSGITPGNSLTISDLNITTLASVSSLSDNDKTRVGKITGMTDPVFGQLEGYGTYTENLYATGNSSISGTLTAGDENGFASTFYAGKIKRNILLNSMSPTISGAEEAADETSPTRTGNVLKLAGSSQPYIYNIVDEDYYFANKGKKYMFSAWMRADEDQATVTLTHGDKTTSIALTGEWKRVSFQLFLKGLELEILSSETIYITSPQMERGKRVFQYQPTDGVLSENEEEYGAWFCKGGIGGTIQNPLLRFDGNGNISSKNGSFVINYDGSGHFANGRFAWKEDEITLQGVTIRWEDLDSEAKENMIAKTVNVYGDNIIHYDGPDSSSNPDKERITITGSENNFVSSDKKWEYLDTDNNWVEISNGTGTLEITPGADLWKGRDSVVIKYTATYDGIGYYDTTTIYKVYSGDAPCVVSASLTSCVVSADYTGSIHAQTSYTSVFSAQKKGVSVPLEIGNLPSIPGVMLSKNGSVLTISFNTGEALANYGSFDIPVIADGTLYSISISYMKVKDGSPGVNPGMLDWIQDWNTNKTFINESAVVTPKIFAGKMNANGTLTGITLGSLNVSVATESGIVSQDISGIYGFKDGKTNWFFDTEGNVQIGNGNNFIKYDAATGKVLFGSDVVLTWSNLGSDVGEVINEKIEGANKYADEKLKESKEYADERLKETQELINDMSESVGGVSDAVGNLRTYIDGAFKTGLMDGFDAQSIERHLNVIETTRIEVEHQHNALASNPYVKLTNEMTELTTVKDNLITVITELTTAIEAAVEDGSISVDEKASVDALFESFNAAYSLWVDGLEAVNLAAQHKLKGYSDDVDARLDTWANDLKVSPVEIPAIEQELAMLLGEYSDLVGDANKYGVSPSSYVTAYANYTNDLTLCVTIPDGSTEETIDVPSTLAGYREEYYDARNALREVISDAMDTYNKTIASETIKETKIGGTNYIKNSSFTQSLEAAGVTFVDGSVSLSVAESVKYQGKNSMLVVQNVASTSNLSSNRFHFVADKVCFPAYFSMYVKSFISSFDGYINIRIGDDSSTTQRVRVTSSWTKVEILNTTSVTSANVYIGFEQIGMYYIAMPILAESSAPVEWTYNNTDLDVMISEAQEAGKNAQQIAEDLVQRAENEGWSTAATYIDANGIFTGQLGANVVNAIEINANQITSGTINASRLNVSDLKSQLITASNINSLTLTTTKGTIGGWKIDSNFIYTGTKQANNDFTSTGITIYSSGTNGAIRSKNFRIDTDGSAYFKGQINASSGYIGKWLIQENGLYNNWIYIGSNGDIYCEDTNGTVYWKIDNYGNAKFCKGKVQFNSGGSGSLAGGNISWDSSGNLTINGKGTFSGSLNAATGTFSGSLNAATGSFSGKVTASSGSIGGWTINNTSISRGNMTLSSSSLSRSGYWALNNDGSGYLAKENISWDTSGNATFNGTLVVSGDKTHIYLGTVGGMDDKFADIDYIPVIGFSLQADTPPSSGGLSNYDSYMVYFPYDKPVFYWYINGSLEIANNEGSVSLGLLTMGEQTTRLTGDVIFTGYPLDVYGNRREAKLSGDIEFTGDVTFSGNVSGVSGTGRQGQGVDYQWSGTSLRLGTIPVGGGSTSWGSWVNLKGATGATGSRGATGPQGPQGPQGPAGTLSASSTCYLPYSGSVFRYSSNNIGIKFSGGNGISGWSNVASGNIGNLYLNDGASSSYKVYITNYEGRSASDMRLKVKFEDVHDILEKISGMNAFYHTRKDEEDKIMRIGVSAQEVMKSFPELVHLITPEHDDAYYAVDYINLATVVAINGCNELHALIKEQKSEIEDLKRKISELEKIISPA